MVLRSLQLQIHLEMRVMMGFLCQYQCFHNIYNPIFQQLYLHQTFCFQIHPSVSSPSVSGAGGFVTPSRGGSRSPSLS